MPASSAQCLFGLLTVKPQAPTATEFTHSVLMPPIRWKLFLHESLVREGDKTWANRALFFAAAAEAMRRILIENVRRKSRLKRGGGQLVRVDISEIDLAENTPDDRVLLIDEALERLRTENREAAKLVTMKFFAGMTNQEIADILGVTERTVERRWAFAKVWLLDNIQEAR